MTTLAKPNGTEIDPDRLPPRGLYCPGCWCQMLRVYYVRKALGRTVRCRICQNCGRKVYTSEKTR